MRLSKLSEEGDRGDGLGGRGDEGGGKVGKGMGRRKDGVMDGYGNGGREDE